jgi:thiol:disulfide interchange protein
MIQPACVPDTLDPVCAVQSKGHGFVPEAERWLTVNLRRIIGFLFLALIIWLIITQPLVASDILKSIAAILKTAATNITLFFSSLF